LRRYFILTTKKCRIYAAFGVSQTPIKHMKCKEERKMPRKPSLDGKDSSLRIRMSPEQKEKLVFYAERHYQTMSNVIFQALDILYAREEQQNNKE